MSNYGNELISVIVPVYNVEQYLEKCVNSIINQTYKNLEIILVDDESTDSSGELCDKLAGKDDRIIVIHKKNGGVSDARNYGIEKAKGNYIGFVDSDDFIDEEMYEKLYEVLIKEDADVVECGFKIVYPNKIELFTEQKYYKVCNKEEYLEEFLIIEKIFGSVWTKLIKSDIAKKVTFPVDKINEDAYYSYNLIENANKFIIFDKPYYNYFMRKNSITNEGFNPRILDHIEVVEKINENVHQNYTNLNDAADCRRMYAYFSVLNSILLEKDFKRNYYYPQIVSYFKENYIKLLKNKYITRNRKLSVVLIKLNIDLYRRVLMKYKDALVGN